MIFSETTIAGAVVIRPERHQDDRGFFARTFCVSEFAEHGLDPRIVQRSVSYSARRGTLRGMHFQIAPHQENKLVSCSRGSIYDVIVDLRRESPSYRRWLALTLRADDYDTLFVPAGCAHGFLTLEDDCVVRYEMSAFHEPAAARGLRFDDPGFGIEWPFHPAVISPRDLAYPPFSD